jgi:hypothetical protein
LCKIVIHVADTGDHSDARINHSRFHSGDIVAVLHDDHVFGAFDLGPHNKVVHLPHIDPHQIEHLVGQDPSPSRWSGHHARLRVWHLPNWDDLATVEYSDVASFIGAARLKPFVYGNSGE